MPELDFAVTEVEPIARGLTPLLAFKVRISNRCSTENIQALIVQAQIQFQPARRNYSPAEKEKLSELFGPPQDWGRTVRNRLWCQVSTTTGAFIGSTEVRFAAPCSYDLNLSATKYFYALDGDDVPLLFLFSGSVFVLAQDGRLQVQPISWDSEASYRMPLRAWQQSMETHFPNSAWLSLRRDVFDRLVSFRRHRGLITWEQTLETLLAENEDSKSTVRVGLASPAPFQVEQAITAAEQEITP